MDDTLLQKLTNCFSPSGLEKNIHQILKEGLSNFVDKIDTLKNSSLIALKNGFPGKCTLMLDAHIDEVFANVTKITDEGFLGLYTSSIDHKLLPGSKVVVHGKKQLTGIIGIKPAHLVTEEETKKAMKLDELYIDCGGYSKNEIEQIVSVGDYVTFVPNYSNIGSLVSNKALDDRVGAYVIIETFRNLSRIKPIVNVLGLFASQEEFSFLGATTSTYLLKPDFAIAIDVTHGTSPDVSSDFGFELGKGPVIFIGPSVDKFVTSKLIEVAEKTNIPFSKEVDIFTGTDAHAIQVVGQGIPVATVSIPLRYMHSPVEVIDSRDIDRTVDLLTQFVTRIDEKFMEEFYGEH